MSYKHTEKTVVVDGREFKAIFPQRHSRVEGLIFEWIDSNAGDSYANIAHWVRFFYIKEKGSKQWKFIEGEHPDYKWAGQGIGWYSVLSNLELSKVREKRMLKEEISEIKYKIKWTTKELKKLKKRQKELAKND